MQSGVTETRGQILFLTELQKQQNSGFPKGAADSYFNKTPQNEQFMSTQRAITWSCNKWAEEDTSCSQAAWASFPPGAFDSTRSFCFHLRTLWTNFWRKELFSCTLFPSSVSGTL